GIPLVIAVQGEDKAEVAARLARTGVALRRAAGEPAGPDIRAAGGAVFGDPAWRTHARCLQTELWRHSSFDQITDAAAEVPRKRGPLLGPAKQLRLPRGDRRRRGGRARRVRRDLRSREAGRAPLAQPRQPPLAVT